MSVRGKNPTVFYGTLNREKRIGKSFKSFIYFLICRNLWAECYIYPKEQLVIVLITGLTQAN